MTRPILVRGVHRILPLGDERSTLGREGPIERSVIGAFSRVLIASALVTPRCREAWDGSGQRGR
jgi:hypothetical protein